MSLQRTAFGHLPDGRSVHRFDLTAGEVTASILDYGGIIASFSGPDRSGERTDVVLGFDDLDGWAHDPQYFGALVGRFANRISGATFPLDGETVDVTPNRGEHHLHGGHIGFDKAVWTAEPAGGATLVLSHHSPDGDEGFPGALDATVTYSLDDTGALTIHYEATTDAPTVLNLTNHVYFNLAGAGTILDHEVLIEANAFLPVDDSTLPVGEITPVDGTSMDFRTTHRVGGRIERPDPQLERAGGYDHCWVVAGDRGVLRPCATVTGGGRRLDVLTTQPGVQFYSGNGIRTRTGRGGVTYGRHSGLCLETQHFPDSPNHPAFPSTRLAPGDRFSETTVYRLDADPGAHR